jgi:hypothetical protein
MRRWLGILIAICLVSPAVDAQVFKPSRSKKAATTKKAPAADPDKKAAKKQPRTTTAKKRPKKSSASERETDSDEETAEPAPKKKGDNDYVKIWNDKEIE